MKENGDLIIDDYIKTPLCDTVHDYLTPYSGIQEADLNPLTSTKHLAIFKSTYTKILYLVENGVVFVGHALVNDFGLIGISVRPSAALCCSLTVVSQVPEEQIRDTVRLYSLPNQRMISLQFLAKQILGAQLGMRTVSEKPFQMRPSKKGCTTRWRMRKQLYDSTRSIRTRTATRSSTS